MVFDLEESTPQILEALYRHRWLRFFSPVYLYGLVFQLYNRDHSKWLTDNIHRLQLCFITDENGNVIVNPIVAEIDHRKICIYPQSHLLGVEVEITENEILRKSHGMTGPRAGLAISNAVKAAIASPDFESYQALYILENS
jgi:hypothetical protein